MSIPQPEPTPPDSEANDPQYQRALQLCRTTSLKSFTLEEWLARVPHDWADDEPSADEYLATLREKEDDHRWDLQSLHTGVVTPRSID